MSVGFTFGKADIDARAGALALDLRTAFERIQLFKSALDTKTDTNLTDLGYTSGEVAILRSAYSDLDTLAQVYYGEATQGTLKDFRTFAKQLTGVA